LFSSAAPVPKAIWPLTEIHRGKDLSRNGNDGQESMVEKFIPVRGPDGKMGTGLKFTDTIVLKTTSFLDVKKSFTMTAYIIPIMTTNCRVLRWSKYHNNYRDVEYARTRQVDGKQQVWDGMGWVLWPGVFEFKAGHEIPTIRR
jgi:hypothetical protein